MQFPKKTNKAFLYDEITIPHSKLDEFIEVLCDYRDLISLMEEGDSRGDFNWVYPNANYRVEHTYYVPNPIIGPKTAFAGEDCASISFLYGKYKLRTSYFADWTEFGRGLGLDSVTYWRSRLVSTLKLCKIYLDGGW